MNQSVFATRSLFRIHSAEHKTLIPNFMTTIGRPFLENNEQVEISLFNLIMLSEKVFASNHDNHHNISLLRASDRYKTVYNEVHAKS